MPKVDPHRTELWSYPNKFRILARFADVDPLWHINNVAIAPACVPVRFRVRLDAGQLRLRPAYS